MKPNLFLYAVAATLLLSACNNNNEGSNQASSDTTLVQPFANEKPVIGKKVTYTSGNTNMNGYIVYDSSSRAKRPVVLVVHEWWGLTDYPLDRAFRLADLGYLAVAVDMYGNGNTADNPQAAEQAATPFYQNPQEAKARLDAALQIALAHPVADTSKTAAIGYCFGGTMVLNAAKLGSNFDGVVSFHGGLEGVPPRKEALQTRMLVLHGEADDFVPPQQVAAFRKSLDSVGANYTFKTYPNATHAFTNPDADNKAAKFNMPIKYNAAADSASWNDMKTFLREIFQ